ncbi:MAG: hypothetical protein BRD52_02480 [Bacteroidetes bacterium SW_4_67_19]|nr:MAG: hypothetical protein BRD52_02480 [Bacteroidetes bacterium SW_4_67_19]
MRSVSLLLLLSLLPPLLGGALAQPVANGTTPYRRHTTADGLPHEDIWALAQAGDGRLWIGTADGLGVFDGETFRRVALPDPVGPGIVNSILARPDGSAWVSVRGQGLAKLRGGRVVRSVPTDQYVRRIVARDETLHVFMRTARWTLPLGSEQQQSFQRQPYDYWIELSKAGAGRGARDAAVAPDGSHWILDSKRGLARLHRDGSVRFISSPPGALPDWETLRFTETGAALIACNDGTLYRFDPDTEQFRVLLRTENPVAHIRLLEQDGRRVAFLGTHGGVLRYDLTRDRRLPPLAAHLDGGPVSPAARRGALRPRLLAPLLRAHHEPRRGRAHPQRRRMASVREQRREQRRQMGNPRAPGNRGHARLRQRARRRVLLEKRRPLPPRADRQQQQRKQRRRPSLAHAAHGLAGSSCALGSGCCAARPAPAAAAPRGASRKSPASPTASPARVATRWPPTRRGPSGSRFGNRVSCA